MKTTNLYVIIIPLLFFVRWSEKKESASQNESSSQVFSLIRVDSEIDKKFAPNLKWGMSIEEVKSCNSIYKEGMYSQDKSIPIQKLYNVYHTFHLGNEMYRVNLCFINDKLGICEYKFLNCGHLRTGYDGKISMDDNCKILFNKIQKYLTDKYGKPKVRKENVGQTNLWSSNNSQYRLLEPFLYFSISDKNNKAVMGTEE